MGSRLSGYFCFGWFWSSFVSQQLSNGLIMIILVLYGIVGFWMISSKVFKSKISRPESKQKLALQLVGVSLLLLQSASLNVFTIPVQLGFHYHHSSSSFGWLVSPTLSIWPMEWWQLVLSVKLAWWLAVYLEQKRFDLLIVHVQHKLVVC